MHRRPREQGLGETLDSQICRNGSPFCVCPIRVSPIHVPAGGGTQVPEKGRGIMSTGVIPEPKLRWSRSVECAQSAFHEHSCGGLS
jgi:hypothetical protein